jgi:6-pyruvoyl-tetrahydropterin synthase
LTEPSLSVFVDGRTFGGSFCVSHRISHAPYGLDHLHGHTYELAVELKGKAKSEASMVFPFEELIAIIKSLCSELNNKTLLASEGDNVYKEDAIAIEYVTGDQKRYLLPIGDVKLLPLEEVTAEALVVWIGEEIEAKVKKYHDFSQNVREIEVTLFEGREQGCSTTRHVE